MYPYFSTSRASLLARIKHGISSVRSIGKLEGSVASVANIQDRFHQEVASLQPISVANSASSTSVGGSSK